MKYNSLIKITILGLISTFCADSKSSQENIGDTFTKSTQTIPIDDQAAVPGAIAGGLYLFRCLYDDYQPSARKTFSQCSVIDAKSEEMVDIENKFQGTKLSITPLVHADTSVRRQTTGQSHWTIIYSLKPNTKRSLAAILNSSLVTLRVTNKDGTELPETSTKAISKSIQSGNITREDKLASLAEKKRTYTFVYREEEEPILAILGEIGETCVDACYSIDTYHHNKGGQYINQKEQCKTVFESFEQTNNNIIVVDSLADPANPQKNILKNEKLAKLGCFKGKITKNNDEFQYIVTPEYDAHFSVPTVIPGYVEQVNDGRRVCACNRN